MEQHVKSIHMSHCVLGYIGDNSDAFLFSTIIQPFTILGCSVQPSHFDVLLFLTNPPSPSDTMQNQPMRNLQRIQITYGPLMRYMGHTLQKYALCGFDRRAHLL